MSLNQNLFVLIQNFCTWSSSTQLFAFSLLCSMLSIGIISPSIFPSILSMLQYTMRVSISRFPLHSELSNLHIKFYLLAFTTINVFYLLRMREDRSRSFYIIQVCLHLATSLMFQDIFKIFAGRFSSCLLSPRWLA
jgi:hypothetical protein